MLARTAIRRLACSVPARTPPARHLSQSSEAANPPQGSASRSVLESAASAFAGIALLAAAGLFYHDYYKADVLRKMTRAFAAGFDPVLELALATSRAAPHLDRTELSSFVDSVIDGSWGRNHREYLLMLGPKGAGKTSLLVQAMIRNEADGVAMMEGHEDLEVFRLRLGKCLEFEFSEDSFAGLFQRKDPREGGPLLDIERALNKLEKVAIKFRKERDRPLVLIFNNMHFVADDPLFLLIQQRAEAWAQAGVLTVVFVSDDFAPYRRLKKSATRMRVLNVPDLTPTETHLHLSKSIASLWPDRPALTCAESDTIWDLIGGRLSFLGRLLNGLRSEIDAGHHGDDAPLGDALVRLSQGMIENERGWLEHWLGLIPDHDDDVMDEQKVSSCSWLLFQEFVNLAASPDPSQKDDPRMTWSRARVVMTRPDFIDLLDKQHILNVDVEHTIRPGSRLMLQVFRAAVEEEGFQETLDSVRARVDEIEALHRTNELTIKKDPFDLGGFMRLRVLGPETGEPGETGEAAGRLV